MRALFKVLKEDNAIALVKRQFQLFITANQYTATFILDQMGNGTALFTL